jgi:hypothetical protein
MFQGFKGSIFQTFPSKPGPLDSLTPWNNFHVPASFEASSITWQSQADHGVAPLKAWHDGLVAGGTVMRRATAATGRTAGSDETVGSFESKLGHLFFQVLFITMRAANGFSGFKNNGLKILAAIQTGIFKNRHFKNLLNLFL